ncbi:type II secretion system F family protein [Acidiphilium iwatense]|uniref:General secretion pathway protein F n=1 Tax=Acidiphilium iwatense TaxID=768198 RepID=A0ABS9DSP6_9PROT|nr:type II secretion system F family protein [Acidiphilium iwatense]MCF3945754.1 type II secretion system F family protein [Acidiphilium iwatense]
MPRFRYSFVRSDGVVVHASADSEDAQALALRVQREHGYLLHATPELSWRAWLARLRLTTGQSSLILALHELGSLVKAGLPVDRSLAVVAALLPDLGLRVSLLHLRDAVRRGATLAEAMEADPTQFSALHVNLVRAGEIGGTLDDTLLRLAEHLRQQNALRSQIQTALIYPAILVFVGISALILLATVVLPQLAPIFVDAGQKIPLSIRLTLGGTAFVRNFGWLIAIALVASVLLIRRSLERPDLRLRWDRFKLKLPLVGPVILAVQTARFARTSGTLLKAGMALPAALGLARQTLTNRALDEALRVATLGVRGGRPLAEALLASGLFPALSSQLISVGEETGHLDEMLLHQAELFERSGAKRLENLVAVLVPTLTIAVGATVASVLASILLAVMQLNQLAS